jgi:perosamine synthetase
MRSHGFSPEKRYWHESWGTNFRLTNLQAAIGVAQVAKIETFVQKKIEIAETYRQALFSSIGDKVSFPETKIGVRNSHWLSVLLLESPQKVDPLLEFLSSKRVETRKFFSPLHLQPAFSQYVRKEDNFPISTELSSKGICLPSSTTISTSEIMKVVDLITEFLLRD